jgi:RimJ/RimL family protein N-acetyltransferase
MPPDAAGASTDEGLGGAPQAAGRTARLLLEPLRPEHALGLFEALDDPLVGRYIGGPDVSTLEDLQARIERLLAGPTDPRAETWRNWVVRLEGTVIGRVEATLHDGIAEIGYVFGPRWWGQGYASEAVTWLLEELRGDGVPEAWATVDPDNEPSVRLLRRVGFEEAGPGTVPLHSYVAGDRVFVRRQDAAGSGQDAAGSG